MATTNYAKLFPSQEAALRDGPTRAADIRIRGAAIAVATGAPPQKEDEARLHAEWKQLSPEDKARVLAAFPLTASGLRALKQTPDAKAERLAQEFPSLAGELRKGK